MKINMPVTKNEVELSESSYIVSKTDLKGRITYVNREFVEISGFSEKELMGKSHNIVRHPDMPPEAFEDLWVTVKAGKPWNGLVKNRCKSGDYYWVNANVAPIKENGRVTGYMSVRSKINSAQKEYAETLYAAMRNGEFVTPSLPSKIAAYLNNLNFIYKAVFAISLPILITWLYGLLFANGAIEPNTYALVGGVVAIASVLMLNRVVGIPVRQLNAAVEAIADGDYKYEINTDNNHEFGRLMQAVKAMQIRTGFEVNNAKREEEEASKLRTALDNNMTPFTFSDSQNRFTYMNKAAVNLWKGIETDVQQLHPDFNVENLMGNTIAEYFESDENRHEYNVERSETTTFDMYMYGLALRLSVVPTYTEGGEYLGRMTQWEDRTAEETAEKEVMRLVNDAVAGNLSSRVDTATLPDGFIKETGIGINQTLDAVISPLNVAADYIEKIAVGDIPEKIISEYHGDFNAIKNNLNQCIDSINNLISEMNHMSAEHDAGDIDVQIDESKFSGAYQTMAQGVNQMVAGHIAVKKQAMACVKGFGEGDFDTPLQAFPGKKAFINEVIEQVRTNLKGLNKDAQMLAEAAKAGNVFVRADANQHQGDFRKIIEGVNHTLDLIVEPIATVKEAVETINTAAGEISTGNNDLSQRTEQQASSLEETASSMEELAGTVKQNAENAEQASQLAVKASTVAIKGGKVVADVVNTMSEINESAAKIEDIIAVIDSIAFQTNILALNAAVEAARAGEQGRGFAVVAGEVRNLAQRSSSAAKEIKELIIDSVTKTSEGTKLVENAGVTMEEIVNSVQHVTNIISEISSASQEQTEGISMVNGAVTNMDESTQQNAALVEEAAAAAESLVDQANGLSDVVSRFKIGAEGYHGTPVSDENSHLKAVPNGTKRTGTNN